MQNREARRRTFGPVTDLERHLPSDWWRTLFSALYLKTDGDVVENGANTVAEVDAIVAAGGLEAGDRILDGWCAHVLEQYENNRIYRPRARYVGARGRHVVTANDR